MQAIVAQGYILSVIEAGLLNSLWIQGETANVEANTSGLKPSPETKLGALQMSWPEGIDIHGV